MLSLAYFPTVPKAAPVTVFNKELVVDSLTPANFETPFNKPANLSPKMALITVVIKELLEAPLRRFERTPLFVAPEIASKIIGLLALFAKPPTTAGSSPLIAFEIPDSLSPK